MVARSWTPVVLVLSLFCGTASAAPTTVHLRVEGSTSTIFEGPVVTDAKTITKGGNTLRCDGGGPDPGPTMTTALDDGSLAGGFTWDADFFGDFFVTRVGPDAQTADKFWGIALNFVPAQVGGCQQRVNTGDEVLFAYDFFAPDFSAKRLLRLSGPETAQVGQPFKVFVTNGSDGSLVASATVAGSVSGADGGATLSFDSPGVKRLKAERGDSIRSNALQVCVYQPGSGACDTPAPAPPAATPVRDSTAPTVRIGGPRNGVTYRRGPRLLRGTASDAESGLKVVKLALRRHVRGRNCRWWSGRRERFVGNHCRKTFFFAVGGDPDWSYLLPRRLPRGHYVLDLKAFDRARNRDERFERGRSRVVFDVVGRRVRTGVAAGRRRGAVTRVMVVGTRGTLVDPVRVRARPGRVHASGRRCRLAASTPMAALVAALRRARVGYHVRDFGRCSGRRAGGSGQLFVTRIGSDRNRGRDGWIYKVDDRAGSTGAADPAGPFGTGLLRRGARVVWFYCAFDAAARSCQPTLRLLGGDRGGRVGDTLGLRVRSYDDAGRGRPAADVAVALGEASVLTDERGVAEFRLSRPGRFTATTGGAGAVPAFPISVRVRG